MEQIAFQETHGRYVLIIDSMSLRRAQISAFLESWAHAGGLMIVEAAAIDSKMNDAAECRLAILNVGGSGIGDPECRPCIHQIRSLLPGTPLAIISDREELEEVVAAFQAGARGFIPSSIEPAIALQALTFILGGGSFYPPSAILQYFERENDDVRTSEGPSASADQDGQKSRLLTERQIEVHMLLKQGKSNKVIARELSMRESTVKVHVRHIMRKLGAANRTQAALCAADLIHRTPISPDETGKNGSNGFPHLGVEIVQGQGAANGAFRLSRLIEPDLQG